MRAFAYVLVLSLVPTLVSAQSHRDVIVQQLDAGATEAKNQGFRVDQSAIPNDTMVGLLPPQGVVWLQVDLRAGVNYVIAGACDFDCSDMDLGVQYESTLVAEDVELDDVPVVVFTATNTGAHFVRVSVPGCEASGCYFGVRVLRD